MATATVNRWGNALAVRLTKSAAKAAGVTQGTPVRVTATKGRIVIEAMQKPVTLDEMLAQFDPARHSGEVMAFKPVGKEAL